MANYSAKILGNAISGIRAQQVVIANTGNNIANVNTPGYSRRTVGLETRAQSGKTAGLSVGNGVDVGAIQRQVDTFVDGLLRNSTSEQAAADTVSSFLSRAEELFSLDGSSSNIGNALTGFFDSANELALNPASIELRTVFLEAGQTLVNSIKNTYNGLAQLQDEAGQRLVNEVGVVNNITEQIAGLNDRISSLESGGTTANDERDRRDVLINQLAEKIGFSMVEASNGSVSISLQNGFALVSGSNHRDLTVTTAPSFATGTLPESLSGGTLSYVTYDYSNGAGTQHVDFTDIIKNQGGILGGLLQVRGTVDADAPNQSAFLADGHLVDLAARVEAITNHLLTSVNTVYLGADADGSTVGHQASSRDLNGSAPAVYGLFDFVYSGSGSKDSDSDGLPDNFPQYSFATGEGNFSSRLQMTTMDPTRVAAALLSGTTAAQGDGRNIAAIAALRTSTYSFQTATATGVRNFGTVTFDGAFQEAVTTVSNKLTRAETELTIAQSKQTSAQNQRDSISGVSLDEEFTSLITSQKAFEASARMIKVAQTLLDELLNII